MNIKTQDDWWILVNSHWQNILDIFANVGAPLGRDEKDHWWPDEPFQLSVRHEQPLIKILMEAKETENHKILYFYFQKVWEAAPDERFIHGWPSWAILCDLCSEYWVFEENENTENPA